MISDKFYIRQKVTYSIFLPLLLLSLLTVLVYNFAHAKKYQINANPVDQQLKHLLIEAVENDLGFVDRFDAEVWLVDMVTRMNQRYKGKRRKNQKKLLKLLKTVHQEATRAGLQPELVLSLIQVESNFDQFAISRVGARGLMQIMPFWLNEIGHPNDNLFDIATNLRFGCTILKYYLKIEKGGLSRALARYNGSLGRDTYPNKVFKALNNQWFKN